MNGAGLLVAALENEGVKQIFGVPGEENLDVVEALRRSTIRLVVTRHEQAAAFMAATHGRLTGKPGVCLSTLGPGALNLSTGAALLAAACGLPVVKHGNRSVSSRSGSADLLEQLGFTLPLDETRAARCFAATGFTFLFAPYFHPAMKALAPIRAALGIRTVFNLLGPLTNPAAPRFRLIGAYDASTAELIAGTLAGMDIERAWVVHGAGGWDEATPIGPFLAFDVTPDAVRRYEIDPREFNLAPCGQAELAGGDAAANLAALLAVFEGRDRGAHHRALILQCGLALFIAGREASIQSGIDTARGTLDSGRANEWLRRLREFAVQDS